MKRMYLQRFDVVRFDVENNNFRLITKSLQDELKSSNFKILPNDKLIFYTKDMFADLGNVNIVGAIKNPGNYELKDRMTINDLILESGGIVDSLYYFRIEIASIDPKSKDQSKYLDVKVFDYINDQSLYGKKINNYIMQPYDKVIVRPTPYFSSQKTVYVGGSVNYPGNYFLKSPNEKASSIILRAGGINRLWLP